MKKLLFILAMLVMTIMFTTSCSSSNKVHKNGLYGKSNHRSEYVAGMNYCGNKTKVKKKKLRRK